MGDYEFHLDYVGQQPGLWNLYTQLTFCYNMPEASAQPMIVEKLTRGLERLTAGFPWVAGKVVKEARSINDDSFFVIKPFEPVPCLTAKDLKSYLPNYDTFMAASFPINLLDEDMIAPRNTLSVSAESDPKPVLLLQLTFLTGGLLLTFAGQHGAMDMVGEGEIFKLFSKACHNVPFTAEELSLGNRDRRTVVSLLDESAIDTNGHVRDDLDVRRSSVESGRRETESESIFSPPPLKIWANFTFSAASLAALKSFAINSTKITSGFISTDDALSAFIWQCVTRARSLRLKSTDNSTFARTVDARRYVRVSATYPGNLAWKTFTSYTIKQLVDEPLGAIASQLRLAVDPTQADLAHEVRLLVTSIASHKHHTDEKKTSRDLSKDIAFSSWSKLDYCWDLDFNLGLGKPEAVRRPSFAPPDQPPMEGLVYLLPKKPDGEITVSICLRDEEMERLRGDAEWSKYTLKAG